MITKAVQPEAASGPEGPDAGRPGPGHPGLGEVRARIERGGAERYHEAAAAKGKLFARERVELLVDAGSFTEDGAFANVLADGLPADGVITGTATVDGRPVALMANDSTVKAGSWGARTVEKIIRIIEKAYADGVPMVYLVDSAGARITDQVQMFPGRRGAGKIFHTQVRASGSIPQVCALFGPSAAGGAYIPAFCDFVTMVDGNASMYLGSPRMVEMVVKEQTTLEEMGGARMHCTVSGVGHHLAASEQEALAAVREYLSYLPSNWQQAPPAAAALAPSRGRPARPWCRPASGRRSTCAGTSAAWSTRGRCSRCTRCGRASWSSASPGWTARPSGWWPTTRCSRAACCSSTRRTRRPGSSSCATPSACRCCSWPTCPASWSARPWSARASSGTGPR